MRRIAIALLLSFKALSVHSFSFRALIVHNQSTDSPTPSPTGSPTPSPTGLPTATPKSVKTSSPTSSPIKAPNTSPITTSPPTASPIVPPTIEPVECVEWEGSPMEGVQNCAYVRWNEKRRKDLCSTEMKVRERCPHACGLCCRNDKTFSFINPDSDGDEWTCRHIGKRQSRQAKWCAKGNKDYKTQEYTMIKRVCPKACDFCFEPVPYVPGNPTNTPPASAPAPAPAPAPTIITCVNVKGEVKNGVKSCNFVRKNSNRDELCEDPKVASKCPISCGSCCEDDKSFSFINKDSRGDEWDCSTIKKKEKRIEMWCKRHAYDVKTGDFLKIRSTCAETCDYCI